MADSNYELNCKKRAWEYMLETMDIVSEVEAEHQKRVAEEKEREAALQAQNRETESQG